MRIWRAVGDRHSLARVIQAFLMVQCFFFFLFFTIPLAFHFIVGLVYGMFQTTGMKAVD